MVQNHQNGCCLKTIFFFITNIKLWIHHTKISTLVVCIERNNNTNNLRMFSCYKWFGKIVYIRHGCMWPRNILVITHNFILLSSWKRDLANRIKKKRNQKKKKCCSRSIVLKERENKKTRGFLCCISFSEYNFNACFLKWIIIVDSNCNYIMVN